ncbi:DUF4097 family beta strand repeat-containing protein [Streptomyces sp. NPDC088387]|uniref:DUF4097 family beta strand repeat-containing protein n=1 Tax=Streptomyces sp. NPDC088387 TaxID=3365859 RepID=UPI0038023176
MSRSVRARMAAMAGVVAVVVAGVTGCASAGEDKEPEHRSFDLPGNTLTIDSDDSALEIVSSDDQKDGRIDVTRWFEGSVMVGKDPKVTWSMDDDRLKLRLQCSGVVADCAAKHRIVVPRGVAVQVKDGDGSVRASGFKDALDIRTGDGSVRVTDTTGPLKLHTGDGSVRAKVDSRDVDARTSDGSIHLELGVVPDRVDSHTGDGSVTISLPRATYKVSTETGDGGVDVSVPHSDSSDHLVSARTGDGKVTVRTAN